MHVNYVWSDLKFLWSSPKVLNNYSFCLHLKMDDVRIVMILQMPILAAGSSNPITNICRQISWQE